jgi:hypothetical protein
MPRGKMQKSLDLIDAAYEILQEIQPASVRAVCYRLFVRGLIGSMEKKNTNKVSRLLVAARREGTIPWEWIVDETRALDRVATWNDPAHYIYSVQRSYRRDFWQQQPRRVEIWVEKGTIRGTLAPIREEWGVGIRVMHGYGSATALHDAAEDSWDFDDEPLLVLYAGDWDPSGLNMSQVDIPKRLAEFESNIEVVRVALTAADVADPDLPSFPAADKRKDTRYPWFVRHYGHHCWELDALSPVMLRRRLEQHIVDTIDQEAWERCARVQAAEKGSLQTILNAWKGASA